MTRASDMTRASAAPGTDRRTALASTDAAGRPNVSAATRERILDAALECLSRLGLAKTSVDAVATEAGVSRQTVYRAYGDRDELLLAAMVEELARNAGPDPSEPLARKARTPADAVAALVEGAIHTLRSIESSPILSALLRQEGASVRATIDGASAALFRNYADELRPWLRLGQDNGLLNADLDPDEMSEWLLRITLSLLTTEGPVQRSDRQLRRYLTTYLTPVLAAR